MGGVTFSVSPATVSIPTGSVDLPYNQTIDFTVPTGIKVVALYQTLELGGEVSDNRPITSTFYIGVTPGSSHKLTKYIHPTGNMNGTFFGVQCGTHNNVRWVDRGVPPLVYVVSLRYRISWSPEINTHTPDRTDY